MPRDASDTRQRILDAAKGLVLDRGYAGTSVDDIQNAAGISRGTFFYHFRTKDDLARAIMVRHAQEDHDLTEDIMARAEKLASDPLQQALIFVALHEEMLDEFGPEGCLFASYSYEAGLFDDETHGLIMGALEHWRGLLGGKLEEAMKKHRPVVPDADPYLLADLASGILQGAFIMRRALGDGGLMSRHLRQFRGYLELLFGVAETDVAGAAASTAADEEEGSLAGAS
jgi:TetR/AcrR family transcriptional regulator, transcriptional repressor for nem operon